MTEKDVQQIERKLIKLLIKIDGYRGDIGRCNDEINGYKLYIAEAEDQRDRLLGDWYNAK